MLAELEQGLLDAIAGSALGARLKKYDFLSRITPEVMKSLAPTAPAVYVATRDITVTGHRAEVTIDALCLARNARGATEALHGDSRVIGLYEIVDALLALMGPGKQHGYTATGARNDRDPLWDAAGLNAAIVTVKAQAAVPAEIDSASLGPFLVFHAEHSLVAGGNEPAAIDEVPLPQ